jgi:hypothetical protein
MKDLLTKTKNFYCPFKGKIQKQKTVFLIREDEICCFCQQKIGKEKSVVALDIDYWGSDGCHEDCLIKSEEI